MKKVHGKIILVDDEKYEKQLLELALNSKDWDIEVEYFPNPGEALEHLRKNADKIFLIISDMDMPGMNGMDFKKEIDKDEVLRKKSIPFIFASNTITEGQVTEAFEYRVQGYFKKPMTIEGQANMLEKIIQYWVSSRHPYQENNQENQNEQKLSTKE
jgi:DNA-binding NtrC family response regulator